MPEGIFDAPDHGAVRAARARWTVRGSRRGGRLHASSTSSPRSKDERRAHARGLPWCSAGRSRCRSRPTPSACARPSRWSPRSASSTPSSRWPAAAPTAFPGPFGAGKTVLQQITSRHADVDIVIVAACGERAGEVVETLREFPELTDPRTGQEPDGAHADHLQHQLHAGGRARGVGLHGGHDRRVLPPDGPQRPAAGRLHLALGAGAARDVRPPGGDPRRGGLPGLPRVGDRRLLRARRPGAAATTARPGSVTIGGTVSPAGGNFEEPVTQSTLKVVGAFHGLSRERSDARRYPAIDPLESWSKYAGVVSTPTRSPWRAAVLRDGNEVDQMMKVVGEEGTSLEDFVVYLKAEFLDAVYLQQDAFHEVDARHAGRAAAVRLRRDRTRSWRRRCASTDKDEARRFFQRLTQTTQGLEPRRRWTSDEFKQLEEQHRARCSRRSRSMHKVYHRIEQIAGNVITVQADDVSLPRTGPGDRPRAAPRWPR